ncbi:MAG: hypothetical protein RL685_3199 [Pseudomonadota bacterium]|jgi:hypothetical protein
MTLKGLSAGSMGGWAAALLQRAKGGVIALALASILGVLASHVALALKWTSPVHYAYWVLGSLALYATALGIGHLGNAHELPLRAPNWRASMVRLPRVERLHRH